MSRDGGQGIKCRRKIAEIYNRLSTVHERFRQTTDGRATAANVNAKNQKVHVVEKLGFIDFMLIIMNTVLYEGALR